MSNVPRLEFLIRARKLYARWMGDVIAANVAGRTRIVRWPSKLTVLLNEAMWEIYWTGRAHVRAELKRQGLSLKLAERPPKKARGRIGDAVNAKKKSIEQITNANVNSTIEAAKRAGLSKSEQRALAMTRHEASIENAILRAFDGVTHEAYNEGRVFEAELHKDQLGLEHYNAMMDSGTCAPCSQRDGATGPVGTFTVPNPDCEGGDLCRCFTWWDVKGGEAPAVPVPAPEPPPPAPVPWTRSSQDAWERSLDPDTLRAFDLYTGVWHNEIREYELKGMSENLPDWVPDSTRKIYEALEKAPKITRTVYRGMGVSEDTLDIFTAKEFTLNSLTSTSYEIKIAKRFAKSLPGRPQRILLELRAKTGVLIEEISQEVQEAEVLLRKGARFVVDKINTVWLDDGPAIRVVATEV